MNDIHISTTQSITENSNALFNFDGRTNVTMSNINVMLYYDLSTNCNIDGYAYHCDNPVSLMYNQGYVKIIGNNSFKGTITGDESHGTDIYSFYSNTIAAFIINDGTLHADNLRVENSVLGNTIFSSYGTLKLYNVIVSAPHMLQSKYVVRQTGNELIIDKCLFMSTSYYIIFIIFAEIYIRNTIFMQSKYVLYASSISNFVLSDCRFYNINLDNNSNCHNPSLFMRASTNISWYNNIFSYHPECGFAMFSSGNNLLLQNNSFIVNHTDMNKLYYRVYGMISISEYFGFTRLINNIFTNDNVEPIPWLYYFNNPAINCLSGNKMNGFCIELRNTNLTSCTRPQLLNCLSDIDFCEDEMYGKMNKDIDIMKSIFIITNNMSSIWELNDNYVALDNVQIQSKFISIKQGNLFLLDSYLASNDSSMDIWYNNGSCNVIQNDRMAHDYNQIAKFIVKCNNNSNGVLVQSMNALSTKIVHHFSATTLRFSATKHKYWPGSVLYFNYSIMDIFGNIITNYTIHNRSFIPIVIQNADLLFQFNIDKYQECGLCDVGITIFKANLLNTLGPYTISVELKYDYLLLQNKYIYLDIVGCPIGYGATSNRYHCEKCPFGKYNLVSNNTKPCLSCSENGEKVSQCNAYFDSLHTEYLYLLSLLIFPLIICMIIIYCKRQYDKAFVINRSLVLIVGVSEFDDKTLFLPAIKQNIMDLEELWRDKYNYDVFVCNMDTLYCTKRDIIGFIDTHKQKLQDVNYGCVIVHIISHGSEDGFLCSNGKELKIDFVCHELIDAATYSGNSHLIKLIFNHGCRGSANYSVDISCEERQRGSTRFNAFGLINTTTAHTTSALSDDSNLVIISGNIKGRTMSDSGKFTKCICQSFGKNLDRIMKVDFMSLFVEIGRNLEQDTNHAELCNINGTLRYNPVRFKKYKVKRTDNTIDEQYQYQRLLDENDFFEL